MRLKTFLILSLMFLSLTGPSYATYQVSFLTISSGSSVDLSSTNYKLADIKGQPVIGESTSTNYKAKLGGIYTLFERLVWKITGLKIVRTADSEGANIKVTWTTDPKNLTVNVYAIRGAYNHTLNNNWKIVLPNTTATQYVDAGQVGKGDPEVYYKVVPNALSPADFAKAWTELETVGKYNLQLKKGFNLAAFSLDPPALENDLDHYIGTQLTSGTGLAPGDEIYSYEGEAKKSTLTSNKWSSPLGKVTIKAGSGAWIKRIPRQLEPATKTITIVGKAYTQPFSKNLTKGFNLVGNPYPASFSSLKDVGFVPGALSGVTNGTAQSPGDEFYFFETNAQGISVMQKSSLVNSSWLKNPGFHPYKGYWYKAKSNAVNWKINP